MKKIVTAFLLSTCAWATTIDTHTLPIYGTNSNEQFRLQTTSTRTNYRYETVQRTCYRNEIVTYQRICRNYLTANLNEVVRSVPRDQRGPREPRDPGFPNPREPREPREPRRPHEPTGPRYPTDPRRQYPYPTPYPRQPMCYDEPVYRSVPYACNETISIPYETIDHQTLANVNVKIENFASSNLGALCGIEFAMNGDDLNAYTNCNNYLALANFTVQKNIDLQGTYVHDYQYNVNLYDMNSLFSALNGGLSNLHLEGNTVVVNTGDLTKSKNYTLRLYVLRKRFLQSDSVLIDRALTANEFTFESTGINSGITKIDLERVISGFKDSKKYKIKVQLNVALPAGTALNRNLPSTHQQAEITDWN